MGIVMREEEENVYYGQLSELHGRNTQMLCV